MLSGSSFISMTSIINCIKKPASHCTLSFTWPRSIICIAVLVKQFSLYSLIYNISFSRNASLRCFFISVLSSSHLISSYPNPSYTLGCNVLSLIIFLIASGTISSVCLIMSFVSSTDASPCPKITILWFDSIPHAASLLILFIFTLSFAG